MASQGMLTTLEFLQKNYGQRFTRAGIAEICGLPSNVVSGSVNALVKKGYVTQVEEVEAAVEGKKAAVVKYVTLAESGLTYDPLAEEDEKKAAVAAERAEKKRLKDEAKAAAAAE